MLHAKGLPTLLRARAGAMAASMASNSEVQLTANSAQDLSVKLAREIDSENETANGARWPLIKRVTVQGPVSYFLRCAMSACISAPTTREHDAVLAARR